MRDRRIPALLLAAALLAGCAPKGKTQAAAPAAEARSPAVSGSFYPADPGRLQAEVDAFLAAARPAAAARIPASAGVAAILVPHAGYAYSGACAAQGFAALEGRRFDTVILLGPPHTVAVQGAAVYTGPGFLTPLGMAAVDTELAAAIAGSSPRIRADAEPHKAEHDLEVQLPFLQRVAKDARIVPILVGGDRGVLDEVAAAVVKAVRGRPAGFDRTLILVSSDLAHYPSAADARRSDAEILSAFRAMDPAGLLAADRAILGRKLPNLACTMCGLDAAYVGLQAARAAGATAAFLMDARTSADAGLGGAAEDRAVGYGSVVLTKEAPTAGSAPPGLSLREPLDPTEQAFLLRIARDSIGQYLATGKRAEFTPPAGCPRLLESRGCFVTLYRRDGKELTLRGCIGMHESAMPLLQLVPRMALAAAFEDPRFPGVRTRELDGLVIEVSVYRTGIVPVASPQDYRVGEEGIILSVGSSQATFLPQVPVEQGWDRTETLEQLSLKAGLDRDAWKRQDARFSVYVTQAFREGGT